MRKTRNTGGRGGGERGGGREGVRGGYERRKGKGKRTSRNLKNSRDAEGKIGARQMRDRSAAIRTSGSGMEKPKGDRGNMLCSDKRE